ncbi:MAG: transketolase [Planctomycetaceae bacterium]|jgi:transketolase|nr:transketolase [Planctomycetaceae bacterium]
MTPAEKKAIDTIRCLAMDAVQQANSGHPGTAMALAPLGYVLFNEFLCFDPKEAKFPNRDRFVLSIGHASMLLYSLLHLSEVKDEYGKPAVSLDDIKNFRQFGSKCAGHPEYGHTTGVEMTTGPLGAGVATSVGMAIAGKHLGARFSYELFDYNVYAVCGDGCMMEGITAEAASLAGHLKLDNLCWFYDDNGITIEGNTNLAFSEDVEKRFKAYGWNVLKVDDVNDLDALRKAIKKFQKEDEKPTLVIVKSVIAYGSPHKAGSHEAHGAPLGEEEIRETKKFYGFDPDKKFVVEEDVYETFRKGIGKRAKELEEQEDVHSALRDPLWQEDSLFNSMTKGIREFPADAKGMASRVSSGKVLNQIPNANNFLIGGSADLAPSNNTWLKDYPAFSPEHPEGRNLHFGIREHAMGAVTNGLTLSGLRGFCATFFVFSDYIRPAIRLAALMKIPTLFIFTHDSIGVGEDGPTHQPVEHLAALRAIPNVAVFRPADANEVAEAYKAAIALTETPSVMVLTRQNLPTIDRTKFGKAEGVHKGGYVVADSTNPQVILIASGSEVGLCLDVYEKLNAEGIKVRVVSMPCFELFEQQPQEYKDSVLPPSVKARVGVELGIEQGWRKYIGDNGQFIGMTGFGASAPADVLMKHFGFTVENVAAAAKNALK